MRTLRRPVSSPSPLLLLLVDDCALQRELTVLLLARLGVTPVVVATGRDAIEQDGRLDFDIILMDLQMPDLDGFDTTRLIRDAQRQRQCLRKVPVVAHSGATLPPDEELLRRCGFDDSVRKPCDVVTMRDVLQRWCAGRFVAPRATGRRPAHA